MKIRVMVVEDEPPIQRSICKKIEQLNEGFQVIFAAENGETAIQYLEKHGKEVDVLFLDMDLPIVSGCGLLEYVTNRKMKLVPVVISGHTDYEYMKSAISNKALDYLLKPLKDRELKLLLDKIEEYYRKQQFEEKALKLEKAMTGVNVPALPAGGSDIQQQYCMVLLTFGSSYGYWGENEWNYEAIYRGLRLEENLAEVLPHEKFWIVDGRNMNEKLIFIRKDSELESFRLQRVLEQLECRPFFLTTVYHRDAVELSNVFPMYRLMQKYTRNHMIFLKDALFMHCAEETETEGSRHKAEIDNLILLYGKNGPQGVYEGFVKVLELLTERPIPYREAMHDIKYYISRMCARMPGHIEYFELENEVQFILENHYTMDDLKQEFHTLFQSAFGTASVEAKEKSVLVKKMKEYLDANFRVNITNQMLARCFGFAPSYLSSIFKAHYGVSPTYYIVQKRMEEGKRLLRENHMKIKDVAEFLGYEDSLYFSKVFKRITGMSPREYVRNVDSE